MANESTDRCFAPVVDAGTRVLILGSLPGQRSLSAGQYYAHPKNQFWRLIGAVIGVDVHARPYASRLTTLRAHGVGLWDSVAEARRPGSLDSALRDIAANDLGALVASLPGLRLIAFNGQKAHDIGMRTLRHLDPVATATVPSSSPAYTLAFDLKAVAWCAALRPALGVID